MPPAPRGAGDGESGAIVAASATRGLQTAACSALPASQRHADVGASDVIACMPFKENVTLAR